jgi:hypothetical protein
MHVGWFRPETTGSTLNVGSMRVGFAADASPPAWLIASSKAATRIAQSEGAGDLDILPREVMAQTFIKHEQRWFMDAAFLGIRIGVV